MTPETRVDLAARGVVGSARFLLSIWDDTDEPAHIRMAIKCLREDVQSFDVAKNVMHLQEEPHAEDSQIVRSHRS